ncbi:hypothetical protein GCM10009060_26870 [Halorubrum trapanicum]
MVTTNENDDSATSAPTVEERVTSGTPFLAEHFEKAAVELREKLGEQSDE